MTVCVPDPALHTCQKPYHEASDVNHGGPHSYDASVTDINGGKMDGFIEAFEGEHPDVDHDALKDPVVYGRSEKHPLPEPILGHSEYQADPVFATARRELLDRLTPGVPRQAQGSSGRSSG